MPVLSAKDVQAKAQQALSASPVYALRELMVERDEETLVITGRVCSFYHKQLAQEMVRQAVEQIEVEVDVINSISVL
ncbi:MAG: BON domain-containing protein [Pirellulales bacterium]